MRRIFNALTKRRILYTKNSFDEVGRKIFNNLIWRNSKKKKNSKFYYHIFINDISSVCAKLET